MTDITPGTVVHVPKTDQMWIASSPEKAAEIVDALADKGYVATIVEPPYPERVTQHG